MGIPGEKCREVILGTAGAELRRVGVPARRPGSEKEEEVDGKISLLSPDHTFLLGRFQ
jgi:hypothetical protein